VVSFTPRSLYPQGKTPWYPLDRRLGGIQSRYGRGAEEKNSQPETENRTLEPRSSSPYPNAILTELSTMLKVKGIGVPVLLTEHHAMKANLGVEV
jgi:hypothetical protein